LPLDSGLWSCLREILTTDRIGSEVADGVSGRDSRLTSDH